MKFFKTHLVLKSRQESSVVERLNVEDVDKVVDDLANLRGVVLRRLGQRRGQLVPQLLPLLPVLVDHPDVVVNVRTGLAVVDVGRVVRPLGGVAPELEDGTDVVAMVEVDERDVHEALLANHRTEPQVLVVVGKVVFGSGQNITKHFVNDKLFLYLNTLSNLLKKYKYFIS